MDKNDTTCTTSLPASEARVCILNGTAPENMRVHGYLDLSKERGLTHIPDGLEVTRLNISGCYGLTHLPLRLRCFELEARDTNLTGLPADIRVENKIDLGGSRDLKSLPENLRVGTLIVRGCTQLEGLPEGLDVCFLDISECIHLRSWPANASLRIGRITARDCTGLTEIPGYLKQLSQLDIAGCTGIAELPEGLKVSSWLDLAHTQITRLPESLRNARLRWRGVQVDARVVFEPETITGKQVLATANAEVRRVMMEQMGLERFFADVNAQVLDTDRDPGGERRLLRISLPGDEDLICLSVSCPSTGRQYVLRVPPQMRGCHQAAAWIAGFDNADDYAPLAET